MTRQPLRTKRVYEPPDTADGIRVQLQAGDPRSSIGRTVEKVEQLLSSVSVSLVYAGYPYDPFVSR
jgi:hypothetical protein